MEGAIGDASEIFNSLPENCISHILSFTSPQNTCSFATLSSLFRSAAESDQVWTQFLPSNYHYILSRADAPIHFSSMKDLFFRLCDPILIDDGKNSITLDKTTGKICYMISAKEFLIHEDWEYPTLPESRFMNVGQQRHHFLYREALDVNAELRTAELSENTIYVVYLVYKLNVQNSNSCFLDYIPNTLIQVGVVKEDIFPNDYNFIHSCLISKELVHQASKHLSEEEVRVFEDLFQSWSEFDDVCYFPKERKDGEWMEVALGEFFNDNGVGGERVFVNISWFNCINLDLFVIEGIEFKPKIW